jgi:UDP-N-acetylmuramoyl-L-alanyl-D-glutamate--2,6-diaminopimelate ligase
MTLIGITGTDGKTSVSQFIAQALHSSVHPCAVTGTLGYGMYGKLSPGSHTTPDAIRLQAELSSVRDQGAKWVAMEVSSHGLDQGRVNGTVFDVAVLTNLSRDHFDYHGSQESYASAKSRLFEMPGLRHAVLNLDDRFGCKLTETLRHKVQVLGYSLSGEDHSFKTVVRAIRQEFDAKGFHLDIESPWGRGELNCKLMGRFNAENVLATLAVLLVLGLPLEEALRRLRNLRAVAGRMEAFGGKDKPLVVVDYAHTLADKIILTDDNPRNESPEAIVRDILAGFISRKHVSVIHERSRAIATAIGRAQLDDVVLVAGKGHEQVQVTHNQHIPFSDKEQVLTYLQGLSR